MTPCPCNKLHDYALCCGKYHENKCLASTPEVLMRSRYSAYVMGNISYIKKTMVGQSLENFDEIETRSWAQFIHWLKLEVIQSGYNNEDNHQGHVEFVAKYLEGNFVHSIHEISQFIRMKEIWYYTDGIQKAVLPLKILRNELCPCGSKIKFKNCKHV